MEILGLREYIDKYFGGCFTAFGKSCGKHKQHIWRQCQSCDYIVVNGKVCQIKYPVDSINNEKG